MVEAVALGQRAREPVLGERTAFEQHALGCGAGVARGLERLVHLLARDEAHVDDHVREKARGGAAAGPAHRHDRFPPGASGPTCPLGAPRRAPRGSRASARETVGGFVAIFGVRGDRLVELEVAFGARVAPAPRPASASRSRSRQGPWPRPRSPARLDIAASAGCRHRAPSSRCEEISRSAVARWRPPRPEDGVQVRPCVMGGVAHPARTSLAPAQPPRRHRCAAPRA